MLSGLRSLFLRAYGAQSVLHRAFGVRAPATRRTRPGEGHAIFIRLQGESLLRRVPPHCVALAGGLQELCCQAGGL